MKYKDLLLNVTDKDFNKEIVVYSQDGTKLFVLNDKFFIDDKNNAIIFTLDEEIPVITDEHRTFSADEMKVYEQLCKQYGLDKLNKEYDENHKNNK